MIYTVATKPLCDGLNLAIVNSNVSKFSQKSNVAQLSVKDGLLYVNIETDNVFSEASFKGGAEGDGSPIVLVDCLKLKQLVGTFDAPVTKIEFVDGGVVLYSGKSKFTLAKIIDVEDMELTRPNTEGTVISTSDLDVESWKFVDDHQMFAIAMSFINPVFTRVWAGQDGDIIVGDMDNGIFTHSMKNTLDETCLLRSEVINTFASVPSGAKITKRDKSYIVSIETDGYTFCSEIKPDYEDNPKFGSYNADIILNMMVKTDDKAVKVNTPRILKSLSQSELLRSESIDTHVVKVTLENGQMSFVDSSINCVVDVEGDTSAAYTINMKSKTLRSAISNLDEEVVMVAPAVNDESQEIVGLLMWTKNIVILVAGAED